MRNAMSRRYSEPYPAGEGDVEEMQTRPLQRTGRHGMTQFDPDFGPPVHLHRQRHPPEEWDEFFGPPVPKGTNYQKGWLADLGKGKAAVAPPPPVRSEVPSGPPPLPLKGPAHATGSSSISHAAPYGASPQQAPLEDPPLEMQQRAPPSQPQAPPQLTPEQQQIFMQYVEQQRQQMAQMTPQQQQQYHQYMQQVHARQVPPQQLQQMQQMAQQSPYYAQQLQMYYAQQRQLQVYQVMMQQQQGKAPAPTSAGQQQQQSPEAAAPQPQPDQQPQQAPAAASQPQPAAQRPPPPQQTRPVPPQPPPAAPQQVNSRQRPLPR